MLLVFLGFTLTAQSKLLHKANILYKANRFAEAAELYREALKERNNLAVKTKLANCYRMNHKMEEAEQLYAEIVADDKAKSRTYYYYGEALMSNGKYEAAKKWFLKYSVLEPDEEKGKLMAAACDRVKTIRPYFPNVEMKAFPQNSDADDSTPVFWKDGIVFSSDRNPGLKLMKKKSGWTGRDFINLYFSKRTSDTTFSEPKFFSAKLNEVNKNTGNPSFTTDGKEIFFTRNGSVASKRDLYNMQLFQAESTEGGRWKNVKKLPFCSVEYNYMHPAISPDGKQLFFVTDKPGGEGGTDIWVSKRKKEGWQRPENLGALVNTPLHEGYPFADNDGKLYFCSKGHPGFGGFDIFVTQQDEFGNWEEPVNLGSPINSPMDDISIFLSKDHPSGLLSSARMGGDDDIFLFQILDIPDTNFTSSTTTSGKGTLFSFDDFIKKLENGQVAKGERFRLDQAQFDEGIYQLTPNITAVLDKLVMVLKYYPTVEIEIGSYTASPGDDVANLALSIQRAEQVKSYLLREGIKAERVSGKGYGESHPLNHCVDGVDCTEEEQLFNQRLEVKILKR